MVPLPLEREMDVGLTVSLPFAEVEDDEEDEDERPACETEIRCSLTPFAVLTTNDVFREEVLVLTEHATVISLPLLLTVHMEDD